MSIRLTLDRYTHLAAGGAASALDGLPELPWAAPAGDEKRARSVALWEEKPAPREATTRAYFRGVPRRRKPLQARALTRLLRG